MSKILYLFPDTNVFIQCRALAELDWKQFEHFAEVDLIVCRSVQREIDRQKNRGNDRVGRRARMANTLFGELAEGSASSVLIHQNGPVVRLSLMGPGKPDSEASELLDYNKPDDELVGYAVRFQKSQSDHEVGVLTHDSGVKVTARTLGLKVYPIDDSWLLPPEPDRYERENQRLKQQVAELENAGPKFSIQCIDSNDEVTESLELEYFWYEPLTTEEVDALVNHLKEAFPTANDFGSMQPMVNLGLPILNRAFESITEYIPASEDEIHKYTQQEYPEWIEACRVCFATLHQEKQVRTSLPSFSFLVSNDGMRPGDNVLVVFECKGEFDIQPPAPDSLYDEDGFEKQTLRLPRPPKPPKGEWTPRGSHIRASSIQELGRILNNFRRDPFEFPSISTDISPVYVRDPEGFFYKPNRPIGPSKQFSLECKLWRHGLGDENFDGEIVLDSTSRSASGILECIVHAENLPTQAKKAVKVKVVAKSVGVMNAARDLIRQLVAGSGV